MPHFVSDQLALGTLDQESVAIRRRQQCCKHVGTFFEYAVAAMVEGRVYETSTAVELCPDVRGPGAQFFIESKSGRGRKAKYWVYRQQVEAYRQWALNYAHTVGPVPYDPVVYYALWLYDVDKPRLVDYKNLGGLFSALAVGVKELYILPLELLQRCAEEHGKPYLQFPELGVVDLLYPKGVREFVASDWLMGNARHSQWVQVEPLDVLGHKVGGFEVHVLMTPVCLYSEAACRVFGGCLHG